MSKNDGGPAFPAPHFDMADGEHGMSLRDYFAAKAMQGMLASGEVSKEVKHRPQPDVIETLASTSYEIADAMLKAREAT